MATIKTIKRRIKAAKNISQITKAMEMVAASKMRKAQEKALSSRPYALKIDQILKRMSTLINPEKHLLLQTRAASDTKNTILILVVSPDKGLCGGLNTTLFKKIEEAEKQIGKTHADIAINIEYVTIGKKAREYVLKTGKVLHAEFTSIPDRPSYEEILPISHLLLNGFKTGSVYKAYILFNDFVNTMTQKPIYQKLLPIDTEDLSTGLFTETGEGASENFDYIFEPDSQSILNWLLPYYFELQVYQKILEAQASEHSARMVAMRNASDNAADIVKFLNLEYNRKRQSVITNEIADIVTSRMAVD